MALCPYCGKAINLTRADGGGVPWATLRPFELSTSTPWATAHDFPARPDFAEYVRSEPVRAATVESDFSVVFLQAVGSGLFVGLLGGGLAVWLGWPWFAPVASGLVTASVVWFGALADSRSMLRRVERVVNRDLDGDGDIGPQTVQHEYTVKEQRADGSTSWQVLVGLPLEPESLREFARGVLAGRTSTHSWAGVLERKEFEQIRDRLISGGFARWAGRNRNQGWELTHKGRAWFTALAGERD